MPSRSLSELWCKISFIAVVLFCFSLFPQTTAADNRLSISLDIPAQIPDQSAAGLAVGDSLHLLARAFPSAQVSRNNPAARVRIRLPLPAAQTALPLTISHTPPDQSYLWRSRKSGDGILLTLTADTSEAIAAGLYGLLQEKLAIRFIHPRQTLFPGHLRWPLPAEWSFSARPRFQHQGFHLHTLHPTELTEQLHDPKYPDAFEDSAAYIDWLARNGQNSFQFFLLRGVDPVAWIPHARRIVDYAHSRGVRCGVEISLAMLQQQAFQSITLLRLLPSHKKQVEQTLAWLFQVPWDFITLESMMGEHLPLLGRLLPATQLHFERLVTEQYQRRLLYATHVIRGSKEEPVRRPRHPHSSILIHTVMFWSISEPKAPVYGNINQRFMLQASEEEVKRRETWYWPESSYWVGFDNSVPLLLLPYLDSRLDDIATMQKIGVQGHLTFSSGWEWGYWLVDWSIARWAWQYSDNGRQRPVTAVSRLNDLFSTPLLTRLWQEALALQNRFLKDKELIHYMAASTPFSELPAPFDLPFQPVPDFTYPWLLLTAQPAQAAAILEGPVARLEQYAAAMHELVARLRAGSQHLEKEQHALADELTSALEVTALRATHRALTLRAIVAKYRPSFGGRQRTDQLLQNAAAIRQQALLLVRRQEQSYRYHLPLLANRRQSFTSYPFGYLHPVTTLHFWDREEQQVRHERFDPLFMNLWDIPRTLGISSLLLR